MSAGMVPSEAVRENKFQASLLGSGGWLIIFGIPWLVKLHPDRSPSSSSHGILLVGVCLQIAPFL